MTAGKPIVLTAGGTGGHMFPAKALAAVLSSKAATACWAEPSKNVCTTCFNADRLAR